jgi:glycosyltransferase involved in cell wall biosynthesis
LHVFVRTQTLRLIEDGWEVHWASSLPKDKNHEAPEGVIFHSLPLSRDPNLWQLISTFFVLASVFRKCSFSMIQCSSPIASLAATAAGFFTRVPVRVYAQWGIRYVGFNGVKRTVLKALERVTCSFATVIQPDSFGNLEFSVEEKLYPRSKAEVVHNGSACGVDLEVFDVSKKVQYCADVRAFYNIPNDAFVFGFVGSIRTDKGLNELIAAFASLQISISETRSYLLLVGDMDHVFDLSPVAQHHLQTCDRILCTGAVKGVERYISAFDCLVFPSYREGFGMVVIEAGAMSVPSIVTDIPGPSESVIDGKTGLIVKLKSVSELAEAMCKFFCNTAQLKIMGDNAKQLVLDRYERSQLMNAFVENKNDKLL